MWSTRIKTSIKTSINHCLETLFSRRNSIIFAILWALLIFFLSHSPNTVDEPPGIIGQIIAWVASWLPFDLSSISNLDKLVHAVFYGIFAFFIFGASRRYLLTLVIASLYGVTDEFHQSFIAGRDSDVWDWVADTVGASLTLLGLRLINIFDSSNMD